ncbi:maleylpyruvate isomerase N-terminal domain-containing protein [Catellatospora tritici]|uniref:maleylpyruvate isomerase N-terminal domain-containing protein n=1 Tax=Catellatospora tritici TaxID=2851566 RepID=UPI001C2CD1C5|nr:maleylpyruvate isomerase N-terminal domain-containing protein [Catellatospora tritici]MBV1856290.1 maleylpyruvate isomerase N-terminal domain-containing protein [Catellatospora tritici]
MTPLDRDSVVLELRGQFAGLADVICAGRSLERPVPGLAWTVGQVAMHLFTVYGVFAAALRDEDVSSLFTEIGVHDTLPQQVAATNANVVSQYAFASATEAAEQLTLAGEALLSAISAADLDRSVPAPWYGPSVMHAGATLAALIGSETLVHSGDIHRGLGVAYRPNRRLAALITPTVMMRMLPLVVDQKAAATIYAVYDVRLRGAGRFTMAFADGDVRVGEPGQFGRSDCALSLTPVAALMIAFGRAPVWRMIATGQALSYGRRPWLALRFPRLFLRP